MDYKQQYMDIFACARVLLGDELDDNVKYISRHMSNGHRCCIEYLKMVADALTAYNEMYPYSHFLHARFFEQQ